MEAEDSQIVPREQSKNKSEQPENKQELLRTSVLSKYGLSAKEFQAVQMRFAGADHLEIAKATGIRHGHLRQLFMKKEGKEGKLMKALVEYRALQGLKMQESANNVIEEAKKDVKAAYDRMVSLSKDASTDAGVFRSNEWLLSVAGIGAEVSIKSLISKMGVSKARDAINQAFMEVFTEPFAHGIDSDVYRLTEEQINQLLKYNKRNSLIYEELDEKHLRELKAEWFREFEEQQRLHKGSDERPI